MKTYKEVTDIVSKELGMKISKVVELLELSQGISKAEARFMVRCALDHKKIYTDKNFLLHVPN